MRRVVLAAAAAGLAAARPSAPSPARASNHTSASSEACEEGGGLPAGEHEIGIEVQAANGEVQQRLFYVHVPEGMPAGQEMPALVSWHGCGSTVAPPWPDFEVGTQLNAATAARKWFNIYPHGTAAGGGERLGWNAGMSTCQTDPATDDVAFARAIFEWMPEHLCLDRSRLFAMGFSNGGAMTFRLQCEFSHLLRAISVTGMRLARDWAPGGALCQPERLIPIVGFCGENDSCHNPSATQYSQAELMEFTARAQGCETLPFESLRTDTTVCLSQAGCGGSAPDLRLDSIEFCTISGLGHTWPGSTCCTDRCLGEPCEPEPGDVAASAYMLEYFSRLPPLV